MFHLLQGVFALLGVQIGHAISMTGSPISGASSSTTCAPSVPLTA
jgi:hypothetical protein